MFLDINTIAIAMQDLQGTADHMIKIWFVLKAMGLTKSKGVYVDTSNSSPQLKALFHSGSQDGKFCIPFVDSTIKYRFMQHDASRSIVQTNIKKWMDGTVSGSDPRSFLDIRKQGGGYYVSTKASYPSELGSDKKHFAPSSDSKANIPLLQLAVWVFAQREIPDKTEDVASYLREEIRRYLFLQNDEESCLFHPGAMNLAFSDLPITDHELYGLCTGTVPVHLTVERVTLPLQRIFYGAPGTGKSHQTNEIVKEYPDTIRTTFHPDSDYASFVGCYKPSMEPQKRTVAVGKKIELAEGPENLLEEWRIVYAFVPQAFTKAYVQAWTKVAETPSGGVPGAQFLVIEEINRGTCAQIFGDLFQLLDRDGEGQSKYPIVPDGDLGRFLAAEFKHRLSNERVAGLPEAVREGRELVLPPNFFIWATMNTSDQSLFPIDSAFKRRWEWTYVPIADAGKGWTVEAGGKSFDWWKLLEKINASVRNATQSEDKQLGYFFGKPAEGGKAISLDTLVNKVLFFLFGDAFKDDAPPAALFGKPDGNGTYRFRDFFTVRTSGGGVAEAVPDEGTIAAWLGNLGVEVPGQEATTSE